MTRFRAFALHLLLSLVIIGGVAFGLFALWYPPSLLGFAKADRLFTLIAAIDIVAGPLLTLIVYKAGKPSLKFDLTVIALLQAAFLGLGLWTAWSSRPVFIVAEATQFTLVFAHEVSPEEIERARRSGGGGLPVLGPVFVGTGLPEDPVLRREAMEAMLAGRPLSSELAFHTPYANVHARVFETARPIEAFLPENSPWNSEIERLRSAHGDLRGVPFHSSRGSALLVLARSPEQPLRALW